MNEELKSSLVRVVPFIVVLIFLNIAAKQKKINADNFFLNKPVTYTRFFLWWIGFAAFVIATEFILFRNGLLQVSSWDHTKLPAIILMFGIVILAPVTEELLFRGLLLQRLIKWKNNIYLAVIIQSIVFVFLHSFNYENTLTSNIATGQVLIDGCLFAIARLHTKSIVTPIAMHATGNLVAVLERIVVV